METYEGALEPPRWVLSVSKQTKAQSADFNGFPAEVLTESISKFWKPEKTRFCAQVKGGYGEEKKIEIFCFQFKMKLQAKTFPAHSNRGSGDKIRLLRFILKLDNFFKK